MTIEDLELTPVGENPTKSKLSLRSTRICIVSYAPKRVIEDALLFNDAYIKNFAYIYHDKFTDAELGEKESKEPHFHILLHLYRKLSLRTVQRWFWCLTPDESQVVNTNPQICTDLLAYYDYMWHKAPKHADRYQYAETDIICKDRDGFLFTSADVEDPLLDAYNDLYNGASVHELVQRYGRDFIIHGTQVRDMVQWAKAQKTQNYL